MHFSVERWPVCYLWEASFTPTLWCNCCCVSGIVSTQSCSRCEGCCSCQSLHLWSQHFHPWAHHINMTTPALVSTFQSSPIPSCTCCCSRPIADAPSHITWCQSKSLPWWILQAVWSYYRDLQEASQWGFHWFTSSAVCCYSQLEGDRIQIWWDCIFEGCFHTPASIAWVISSLVILGHNGPIACYKSLYVCMYTSWLTDDSLQCKLVNTLLW